MFEEMSGRGNVLVGKRPLGEVSVGEVSVRDLSSGKCQLGNCPKILRGCQEDTFSKSPEKSVDVSMMNFIYVALPILDGQERYKK